MSRLIKRLLPIAVLAIVLGIAPKALANLRFGDQGGAVFDLQEELGIAADGIFGSQTEAAVRAFQRRQGLLVDGIAGPETLSALGLDDLIGFQPLRPDGPGSGFIPIGPGETVAGGPYVVVIPDDGTLLNEVQRAVPEAFVAESDRGSFINAGGYTSRDRAEQVAERLSDRGLSARVVFRP